MTEPLRFDPSADAAEVPERDRDARVEELLLSGLDHYFNGQHDLAINIWTRVLFLDRGHARARAYIERARSAVSERQREGEELIHSGAAAFERGDVAGARRLLTSALERGAATEDAFALLARLQRLEAAGVPQEARHHPRTVPVAGSRTHAAGAGGGHGRLAWIAAGAIFGMAAALTLMLWAGGDTWLAGGQVPELLPGARTGEMPLPVPTPADIAIMRARELYEKGRLRDALAALEPVRQGDARRGQADDLRATIQRRLLETRSRDGSHAPGAADGGGRE